MSEGQKAKLSIPDWPEYVRIMGAAFRTHGSQAAAIMKIHDRNHPATKMLEEGWTIHDEMYLFERYNKDVHLLVSMDTEKMDAETLEKLKLKKGEFAPVAWTNTEGKGRVFYTSLGHREDVWTNPVYQQHLLGGIAWALGQGE
jgi:type 1 glutamine amidotransferase